MCSTSSKCFSGKDWDKLCSDLKKIRTMVQSGDFGPHDAASRVLNWKVSRKGGVRTVVLIGEKYVFKSNTNAGRKPKLAVPQKTVRIGGYTFAIQPKVDTNAGRVKAAIEKLTEKDDKINVKIYGEDFHELNAGILDGELVIFDW